MRHLRPKLRVGDIVCRTDDFRHTGMVVNMFKWKKYNEWTADIRWDDHRKIDGVCKNPSIGGIFEYVPMGDLVHHSE
jgi:hypothetical protein